MTSWGVWVDGVPKAQPRVRAFRRGRHASVYTPDTADTWKAAVRAAVAGWPPISGPVAVRLVFAMPRPKRLRGVGIWHAGKPDADNLAKAVLDAMGDAGTWTDDAQVAILHVEKLYADPGWPTGCRVLVTALTVYPSD